jgi:hypothetical protein
VATKASRGRPSRQYPYLPRLRHISVLEGAVRDGTSSLLWRAETFAYAAAREVGGTTAALSPGGSPRLL